jgi:ABC-type multidrug transport system fused ATPase/permease subunit
MALEELAKSEVAKESVSYLKKNVRLSMIMGAFFPLLNLLTNFALALTIFFGGGYVIKGVISPGDFVAFLSYLALFAWPLMAMGYTIGLMQQGFASLSRLAKVLSPETEIREIREMAERAALEESLKKEERVSQEETEKEALAEENAEEDATPPRERALYAPLEEFIDFTEVSGLEGLSELRDIAEREYEDEAEGEGEGQGEGQGDGQGEVGQVKSLPELLSLEFKEVSFGYPGRRGLALNGLSASIPAFGLTALTGPTGSGKSTLASLLPALFRPSSGEILINGKDSGDFPPWLLRSLFTYIPQDGHIFTGTLFMNVAFGKPEATMEEALWATEIAGLPIDPRVFPEGLMTRVGERGLTLSGGQRQRLALARAVLMDPPYLILDDTLSAVDASVEDEILNKLLALRKERGTLIISHRVTSLKRASRFLVMENGTLTGEGTFDEVYRDSAYFRRITELANLGLDCLGLVPAERKIAGDISQIPAAPMDKGSGGLFGKGE